MAVRLVVSKSAMALLLLALLGAFAGHRRPASAEEKPTVRILWIGNSYTADCWVPKIVAAMTDEDRSPLRTDPDIGCVGGKDWKFHFADPESRGMPLLKANDYDIVVLQNHSVGAIHERDEMMDYGRRFVQLIRERGAAPLLYCTWPRREDKVQTGSAESDWRLIRTGYEDLAEAVGAAVAPVGHAWVLALARDPAPELYAGDGSHPSALGAYLTACVFYATLTGESPVGLAHRGSWQVGFPEGKWTRVSVTLDDETALALQRVAWAAYSEYSAQ